MNGSGNGGFAEFFHQFNGAASRGAQSRFMEEALVAMQLFVSVLPTVVASRPQLDEEQAVNFASEVTRLAMLGLLNMVRQMREKHGV